MFSLDLERRRLFLISFQTSLVAALLFGGNVKVNPAHPKQIGSIDPHCGVSEVIRGKISQVLVPSSGLGSCFGFQELFIGLMTKTTVFL